MTGTYDNPYKFNAKELDAETGFYYYGARYYNPKWSQWYGVDPLAEKYPSWSPYNYTADNPINYIDPDGREIIGVTKKDAQNFKEDIYKVLADKKFDQLRSLIDIKGKTFIKVDPDKLSTSLKGAKLSADEEAYINMVTNTINSSAKHKIEYISGDFASSDGSEAFKDYMNTIQAGVGDKMVNSEGLLSAGIVKAYGDGYNVPTLGGSHSFIGASVQGNDRSVTSAHELFGHGIPSSKKLSPASNNANAIRTDNLARRLLGIPERDGSNHGGYNEGHITEPKKLPMTTK